MSAKHPTPRLRCAIYTRKSSEEGLDQAFNSLDAQREACAAYILSQAGKGWSATAQTYEDGGYSGGTLERPALQRLLSEVSAGRVDVVVVYKVDRLTRSLGDFARIVEILDAAGASFVSVTQAFNTTTSMGRLTLNVLLSFAQFEREVTGERIRDKIAASKAKGMWMGGVPPLGYKAKDRALVLVPCEAETVRHIFRRYLALGSVHALKAELDQDGHRSKAWVSLTGRSHGGVPFARGALFHILSNRAYLGETTHKGVNHPGLHPAIVDTATFEAAQALLARRAGPRRRARVGLSARPPAAPLTGLIFDAAGDRMSPVAARKPDGRRYRYYVSSRRQKGQGAVAGMLHRAPAEMLETMVLQRAIALELIGEGGADPWPDLRRTLNRVEVARRHVRFVLHGHALPHGFDLARARAALPPKDQLELQDNVITLTIPVSLSRRGQGKTLTGPDGLPSRPQGKLDPALSRALVQAEAWKRALLTGKHASLVALGRAEGLQASHCERILRLAFLAPDLKRAILEGRAPAGLMLQRLRTEGVPDLWSEQRRQIQAASRSCATALTV